MAEIIQSLWIIFSKLLVFYAILPAAVDVGVLVPIVFAKTISDLH